MFTPLPRAYVNIHVRANARVFTYVHVFIPTHITLSSLKTGGFKVMAVNSDGAVVVLEFSSDVRKRGSALEVSVCLCPHR